MDDSATTARQVGRTCEREHARQTVREKREKVVQRQGTTKTVPEDIVGS